MKVKIMLKMTSEEITKTIPYELICETYCRDIFNTGKAKRIRSKCFTDSEWDHCIGLCRTAYKWMLKTGVPNEVEMSVGTLSLWKRLAIYCYHIS